jgi:hypothetical protein
MDISYPCSNWLARDYHVFMSLLSGSLMVLLLEGWQNDGSGAASCGLVVQAHLLNIPPLRFEDCCSFL